MAGVAWQRALALLLMVLMGGSLLEARVVRKRARQQRSMAAKKAIKRRVAPRRRRRRSSGLAVVPRSQVPTFSKTICKFFAEGTVHTARRGNNDEVVWGKKKTDPFNELILSWNALRPGQGHLTIWVAVNTAASGKPQWSSWHRLALWGAKRQLTFLNKMHPYVHTRHCRVALQHGRLAYGFRARVVFHDGAKPESLKALFGCISRLNHHKLVLPDKSIKTVKPHPRYTKISQFMLNHPRKKDICSPVSTAMVVSYFHRLMYGTKPHRSMSQYALEFTKNVHDQGYLNIYGNWILNTAHAFHALNGDVYFSVQRLNSFYDLYHYIAQRIPVVVSVRRLPGGATPYAGGHLLVVIGWDNEARRVICLDPAFAPHHATLKSYPLLPFIRAWGRSNNLSYVALTKPMLQELGVPLAGINQSECVVQKEPAPFTQIAPPPSPFDLVATGV